MADNNENASLQNEETAVMPQNEASAENEPENPTVPEKTQEASASEDQPSPVPDYVEMTLNSGVAPLEVRYAQINNCYSKTPVAYRSFTYINSVVEGVIPPEKYSFASDGTDRGLRLAKWNVEQAIKAVRAFEAAGRTVDFVTARVPAKLALETDVYEWLGSILKENRFDTPQKLCLEFSRSALYEDLEKIRSAVLSLKLLKVRSLMTGCGEKDCPITSLIEVPFDMVLLAPWLSALTDSRTRSSAVLAVIGFLRTLNIEVIGEGVYNDEQITALNRADCMGYIPSSGYTGSTVHGRLRMPLDEAVAQKGEDA